MNNTCKVMSLLAMILFASGCTNQDIYNSIQKNRQNKCSTLPPLQYEECMKQHSETYQEYKRKRDVHLEGNESLKDK